MRRSKMHAIRSPRRQRQGELRHREAKRLGGLQIDDKLEFGGGLNGKVARLFALQEANPG